MKAESTIEKEARLLRRMCQNTELRNDPFGKQAWKSLMDMRCTIEWVLGNTRTSPSRYISSMCPELKK